MRITKYFFIMIIVFTGISHAGQTGRNTMGDLYVISGGIDLETLFEAEQNGWLSDRIQEILDEMRKRGMLERLIVADPLCFIANEFEGYSVREYKNDFEPFGDGISGGTFRLQFIGESGGRVYAISYDEDDPNSIWDRNKLHRELPCIRIGRHTLVCVNKEELPERTIIEKWIVFPEKNKVVYMKTDNGLTLFPGASLFVGEIAGTCGDGGRTVTPNASD